MKEKPKRILVVGCGDKCEDVKAIVDELGSSVIIHGVDIIDNIGSGYINDNVLYIKADASNLPICSEYYDLAYSFATFEHIKDVHKAWQCMVNVLKPGGMLWTVASPVWTSPFGHHKSDIFKKYPYIHLKYPTPADLLSFCKDNDIKSNDSTDIVHHINYMLHDDYFNKLKPKFYLEAANALENLNILKNTFDCVEDFYLNHASDLIEIGAYEKDDLLSITHRLCGLKI